MAGTDPPPPPDLPKPHLPEPPLPPLPPPLELPSWPSWPSFPFSAVPLVPGQGAGSEKRWLGQVGQACGCGLEERRGMAVCQPKMSLPAATDQSRLAKDQAPREQ